MPKIGLDPQPFGFAAANDHDANVGGSELSASGGLFMPEDPVTHAIIQAFGLADVDGFEARRNWKGMAEDVDARNGGVEPRSNGPHLKLV